MAKEIIWSPRSEITFYSILNYLKENWSEKEVENFILSTVTVINYIAEHPQMFRKTNKPNVREALVTPQNLLVYKVFPEKIVLIAFYDTRQNPRKKPLKI